MILFFELFPKDESKHRALSELELRYKLAKLENERSYHYRADGQIVMR